MADYDPLVIIAVLVGLSLLPFIAVMVTSFLKIVVVLSLLRNALGIQQIPPNIVLNGLAIILSVYIMAPVAGDSPPALPISSCAGAAAAGPPVAWSAASAGRVGHACDLPPLHPLAKTVARTRMVSRMTFRLSFLTLCLLLGFNMVLDQALEDPQRHAAVAHYDVVKFLEVEPVPQGIHRLLA